MDNTHPPPELPNEIIIEIAERSSPDTKSRFLCLNRYFLVKYKKLAKKARCRARTRISCVLETISKAKYRTIYYQLPNGNIDGQYKELYNVRADQQECIKRVAGYYLNGHKHGRFITSDPGDRLLLSARYYHGQPVGVWRSVNWHPTVPGPHPVIDGKTVSPHELSWIDMKARVMFTWIKYNHDVRSVKITKNINLGDLFEKLHERMITTYDLKMFKRQTLLLNR
jgi:hypothetical protein